MRSGRTSLICFGVVSFVALVIFGCATQPAAPVGVSTTQPTGVPPQAAQVNQLDGVLKQAQSIVTVLGSTIATAAVVAQDPAMQALAAAIPYGSLAVGVLGVVAAVIKHAQAASATQQQQQTQKALTQVVGALDAALPNPTPEQQSKIASVLDTDVKAKVAAARVG